MSTVHIHNSVTGAIIDAHLSGEINHLNSPTGKAHAGGEITWNLEKLGWADQRVTVSVKAEGGVTRHSQFDFKKHQDYRFKANGTTLSFQVNGPL